jgi:hypothetical protein
VCHITTVHPCLVSRIVLIRARLILNGGHSRTGICGPSGLISHRVTAEKKQWKEGLLT